ncbi:MAG: TAXI family TRAP transporter solute-binding subunit [Candidatus Electrothrix sp. AUS4]|nr:TAXI family TRAP transporter solute-binding subunit [Candidatus Electrothrix sp. AUS4]
MEPKEIAMKIFFSCKVKSLFAAVLCVFIFSSVQAAELSIATGGSKGTYFQIGSDISKLIRQHGLGLDVMESKGSLDNIDKIYERKYNRVAIVQSDILEYLRSSDDHRLRAKAENIKMIIPLYNEEVHILVHDSIRDLNGLNGKKVAIGPLQSGTAITASLLFKKSGVTPGQLVYSSAEEALSSLRSKAIDAMVYVSGYPVSLFSQISPADKLQLVPIMDRRIGGSYIMSCIPERTYTWQKGIVPTIAVKAVLVSYDYNEKQQASKDVCEVGKIIYTNIDWLKRNGHSKWGNVRLDDSLDGWEKNGCIKDAIMSLSSANFY